MAYLLVKCSNTWYCFEKKLLVVMISYYLIFNKFQFSSHIWNHYINTCYIYVLLRFAICVQVCLCITYVNQTKHWRARPILTVIVILKRIMSVNYLVYCLYTCACVVILIFLQCLTYNSFLVVRLVNFLYC